MTDSNRSASLAEVCAQLAELTAQAAEFIRTQAASADKPSPVIGEFFEDLANVHLDIAHAISELHRPV